MKKSKINEILKKSNKVRGLKVFQQDVFHDFRGNFYENFKSSDFADFSNCFIQSNIGINPRKYTLRGIHLQKGEYAQAKIVSVLYGEIIDVIVDLRKYSDTYLNVNYIHVEAKNPKKIYIPKGCGHAYITLKPNTIVEYFVNEKYIKEAELTYSYKMLSISEIISELDLIMSIKDSVGIVLNEK